MMRLSGAVLLATLTVGVTASLAQRVDPGAENWLVMADVGTFRLTRASLRTGGGGIEPRFFGDHPDNLTAVGDYEDGAHSLLVGASVTRDIDTTYIERLMESEFRDDATGRFHSTSSLVSLLGNTVFLYCEGSPDCKGRIYEWRSGADIIVSIDAGTVANDITPGADPPLTPRTSKTNPPCPEPTEILQAYLQRYPSSLTMYTDSDERARQWQRDMMALEVAAAQYKLADAARKPVAQVRPAELRDVESHLTEFALKRQLVLSGPKLEKETPRIEQWRALTDRSRQLAALKAVADEYQAWWSAQGYGQIEVPALPPPPAVPTPIAPPTNTPAS